MAMNGMLSIVCSSSVFRFRVDGCPMQGILDAIATKKGRSAVHRESYEKRVSKPWRGMSSNI